MPRAPAAHPAASPPGAAAMVAASSTPHSAACRHTRPASVSPEKRQRGLSAAAVLCIPQEAGMAQFQNPAYRSASPAVSHKL